MCFDRMDLYYDRALKAYCRTAGKDPDSLTDEERDEVALRACNHIGFFLTWLIRRDHIGPLRQERSRLLDWVCTGTMSGGDFLLAECGGELREEDVCPDILPFVKAYYGGGQYWKDYMNWVFQELEAPALEFVGSWEQYLRFEPLLDKACQAFYRRRKQKNIHAEHRKRMKAEFRAQGLQGMSDHRILELLLFFAIPQGDVNPLAHALIDRFGTLSNMFHATYDELVSVKGISEHTATLIMLVLAVGARYLQEQADVSHTCQTTWDFHELLKSEFYGARNELVYIVCLDGKFKLIAYRKIGEGIADAATITTRKVLETALSYNASIVVLAHNHTSGLALPSAEDIATTRQLARSLRQVGIWLYDHFIIVDDDMTSMRASGYLSDS